MLQLDNISTKDGYPGTDNDPTGALTDQNADLLSIDVAGADVYLQFRPFDSERQNELDWTGEDLRIVAPKSLLVPDVAGVRVKSARPGTPASVTAQLFQPDDPGRPSAASSAVQVVTTVGQTGVQHNEVLQGAENTLDLDDSAQIVFSVADDAPNGRVKISAAIAASVALTGTPTSPTPGSADNSTKIATTAYVQAQGYVTSATAPVTSVDGRTGAVTGLADLTSASTQAFAGSVSTTGAVLVGSGAANAGAGTLTTTGRIYSGAAATGGIWVDGGASQFIGSNDATHVGIYNTGWVVTIDQAGSIRATGSVYVGRQTASPTPTTTWTPNYGLASSFSLSIGGSGGGTLTIANALNAPSASQSAWLYIEAFNPPGNTATAISWGSTYYGAAAALPATLAQGAIFRLFFVWNGGSWVLMSKATV